MSAQVIAINGPLATWHGLDRRKGFGARRAILTAAGLYAITAAWLQANRSLRDVDEQAVSPQTGPEQTSEGQPAAEQAAQAEQAEQAAPEQAS
jgi:uncharacterized membrane protein